MSAATKYPHREESDEDDGDDDNEEEEGEDSEEEGEEEEPKLTYHRLGHNVADCLKADAASVMAAHEKFLALGTHWGAVHIFDFAGHEIKKFSSHSTTVNDLDISSTGEYVASCSDDGKVVIHGITNNDTKEEEYNGPVNSIALEPNYARSENQEFVAGGKTDRLTLNTKGWFGVRKNVILHQGEGPIHCVRVRLFSPCQTGEAGKGFESLFDQ